MASRRDIKASDEAEEAGAPQDEEVQETEAEEDGQERDSRRAKSKRERVAGRSTWQRFKAWFRDDRLYLYAAFFLGSIILAVLGVLSAWAPTLLGEGLANWFRAIGSFNTYLFLFGFICLFSAGYLFFGLMFKRAEFQRLVSTKSKADFTHSLDHIERLAFELGTHENEVVAARKREFKIRH
jgi:hypothetical protein